MKRPLLIFLVFFSVVPLQAQHPDGNYNPYVGQGIISPAPLQSAEKKGTGMVSFRAGNTGSDPLIYHAGLPDQSMILTITLAGGTPDITPLNIKSAITVIGGSFASRFNWSYDVATNSYRGVQNKTIAGMDLVHSANQGLITVRYRVSHISGKSGAANGFSVRIDPPAYARESNSTGDDTTSSFTWTE